MQRVISTLLLLIITLFASARVTTMEFYWDTDPGVGAGTQFTVVDGNWGEYLEEAVHNSPSVPTTVGAHTLFVRAKDGNSWGASRGFPFYIGESQTFNTESLFKHISTMEYYWDTDPGVGAGTQFTVVDGNWGSALENVIISGTTPLQAGAHTLYVRTKDRNNEWSKSRGFPIFIEDPHSVTIGSVLNRLSVMEFYWDTDPGAGNGTQFSVVDGNWGESLEDALKRNSSIPTTAGSHILYVRAKRDSIWGASRGFPIYIEDPTTIGATSVLTHISTMEYYWDTDPGAGKGFQFTVVDGNWGESLEDALKNSVSTPTTGGNHILYVRAKRDSVWGKSRGINIYIENPTDYSSMRFVTHISTMEYYWDTDPGKGAGTQFTVVDGKYSESLEDALNSGVSTPSTVGSHTLYVRSKSDNGVWSQSRGFPIYIDSTTGVDLDHFTIQVKEFEYYVNTDPGVGSATLVTQLIGGKNLGKGKISLNIPATAFNAGYNIGGFRVKNSDGTWGKTRYFSFYVDRGLVTVTTSDSTVSDTINDTLHLTNLIGATGQEDTIKTTLIVDSITDSTWVFADSTANDSLFASDTTIKVSYKVDTLSVIKDTAVYQPFVTENIILKRGWNLVSFTVVPQDGDITTICTGHQTIKIVKDGDGNSYIPNILNTIGTISVAKGYSIYSSSVDTISVKGVPVDVAQTTISLKTGWNILPFIKRESGSLESELSAILSKIKIVKDDKGNSYIPAVGINTIGDLHSSEGYNLYIQEDGNFNYSK